MKEFMKKLLKTLILLGGFLIAILLISMIAVWLKIPPNSLGWYVVGGFIGGILGGATVTMFFSWVLDF